MVREDLRNQLPPDMISKLIDGEKVYYHVSGGGCMGFKPKTYFMISNNRVLFSGKESEGCLGLSMKTYDHALPLEHISSISSGTEGCTSISFLTTGKLIISTSGGANSALFDNPGDAQKASKVLHEILNENKKT